VSRTLGPNVRRARVTRRYSQLVLATKAGVSQSLISRIEHNQENPTLATLSRIAVALGTRVAALLEDPTTDERVA
jgi:XRE family transcriptional regulator, regulator of sulfur utilization